MSEESRPSNPPPGNPLPPVEPAENEKTRAAAKTPRKKAPSRQSQRIDRLFTRLDEEIIDPNGEDALSASAPPVSGQPKPSEPAPRPIEPTAPEPAPAPVEAEPIAGLPEFRKPEKLPEPEDGNQPRVSPAAAVTDNAGQIDASPHAFQTPRTTQPYLPRWFRDLEYQAAPSEQAGGESDALPAGSLLSGLGWENLSQEQRSNLGELGVGTDGDQFATLTYALPFVETTTEQTLLNIEDRAALLLEIVDDDPTRQWSEDELLLVEQVSDQLSLALENARLFEEARTRSEYLAILNEMSRALSTQLKSEDVVETIYHYCARLIEAANFYLALYHEETQEVSFPLAIEDNQRVHWRAQPLNNGLNEYVFRTREALLIRENVAEWIANQLQIEIDGRQARSWLGVPMIFGEQVIGVIAVQNYARAQAFDANDRDLLSAVASQAAVALLNARLFEQTQAAFSALEVSERYQKGVAQAVAILTERGIAALSDALAILGEAAQSSRAYYIETQVDARGSYWRLVTEWHAPGVASQIGNPALRRLSTRFLAPWLERLIASGYISASTSDLPGEQKEFLEAMGTRSILQFAIAGRHELPGCIGFEQVDQERAWGEDEISALQTAASALANTIAREDLFTQVQMNLAETEALYQASARLNSAATYEEILQVLRQHTILGHVNTASITLNVFDKPWNYRGSAERGKRPAWLLPLARWDARPLEKAPEERYPLDAWPTIEALLQPERPTLVTDIANDPRIDEIGRRIYLEQMSARSLLYIPLNVAGQWIGHIIAVYRQTTGFPESEVRRLTSLAGQAAVGVQNLQSIDLATRRAREAQERSEELAVLNQITAAASETLDLGEVLDEILGRVLSTTGYSSGLISVLDSTSRKLKLAVHQKLPDQMVRKLTEQGMDGTPCDLVYRLERTLHIADLKRIPEDNMDMLPWQNIFAAPLSLGFHAYLGVPLESKGQVLGTVCIFNVQPLALDPARILLLQAVGQQVGVVVENAELFQETQNALSETETLYQAGAELSAIQSYNDILDTLRKYTVLGQTDRLVNISLFNRPSNQPGEPEMIIPIAHWTTLPPDALRQRYTPAQYPAIQLLSPGEVVLIEDIANDPRLDENTREQYLETFQAKSAIFVPLSASGEWLGFINGFYGDLRRFSEAERRRLVSLSGQAAVAVQNLRLLEESLRRANQLQTAAEIARDTSSTLALDALLGRAVNLLRDRFGYYHASIFLLDESGAQAWVHESTGEAGAEMKRSRHHLPVGGRSVIGQATASGKPLVLNDVTLETARDLHSPNPLLPNTRAELGIPLQIGGRVIGALDVQSTQPEAFSDDDVAILQTLADQIAVAVDNARSYELAQQAMEEIREADRLKSQFLANMSHELRTPLNSIIGFSRVILKGIDGPINDLQQQDLTAIYNSGQHLLGLINDVLDLSKIEAGKMDMAFEENASLQDIIKGVMSTTVGLVKDKPIKLVQEIAPDIPPLYIDPMKVRQVLLNLLSNAAKFTDEGSIMVKAELSKGSDEQEEVLVSVIDSGPGIAPEDQKKLFQPFSQVDGSLTRKTGGSGLGLSICNYLVQMHGGRIGLRSTLGKGSTFYFSLPIRKPSEPMPSGLYKQPELPDVQTAEVQPAAREEGEGALQAHVEENTPIFTLENSTLFPMDMPAQDDEYPGEPARGEPAPHHGIMLAIDPDHQVIEIYRRYLSRHGYTVVAITELEQAIGAARGIQPAAITLDISMQCDTGTMSGKLDGWQVLKQIKSDPAIQKIPVVVCTLLDERDRAIKLGASDYLTKPILEDELAKAIERLVASLPSREEPGADLISGHG